MGKVVAAGVLLWHRVVFLRVFDFLIKTLIFAGGGVLSCSASALLGRLHLPISVYAEAWLCSVLSAAVHRVCTLPG